MATVTAAAASNSTSSAAESGYVSPWGPVAAVLLCLAPILLLAAVTLIKRISLPSSVSLPLSAALLALIRLAYLQSPPLFVMASIARGCLEALTPLSVIFGAILLFESMEETQCLPWMMFHVRNLSAGHPLAEVFLIAWSFAYVLSGVGGFNTFILGAPMLVSLGHDPKMTVVVLVILNTLASHMGSVGMAIWFGFKSLGLGEANILLVGLKSSIIVGLAAFIVAPIAASHLVPWGDLLRSSLFVILSILSAVVPTVLFSIFSAEFPVLIGGLVSMAVTALLVYFKVGLRPSSAGAAAGLAGPSALDCQMLAGVKPAARAAGLAPAAGAAAAGRGGDLEAQLEDGSSRGISSSSSEETASNEPSAHSSNACSSRNTRLLSVGASSDQCASSRPGTDPSAAGHGDDGNSEASHRQMLAPQHLPSHPPDCCMPAAGAEEATEAAAAGYRSLATISCPLPYYSNATGLTGLSADVGPALPSSTSQRARAPSHDAAAGGQSSDRPDSCHHKHSRSLQQQLPPLLLPPEHDPLLLLPPDSLAGSYHFPYSLPQQQGSLLPCTNPLHLAAMQAAGVTVAGGRFYSAAGGPALPPAFSTAANKHRRSWHGQLPSQEQLMSFTCPGRILQALPPPAAAAGGLSAAATGGGSLQRVSLQRVLAAAASGTRDELDAAVEAALAEEAAVFGYRCRGVWDALARTLPIWLTVLLLLVTRIPQLHIRAALQSTTPGFSLGLGSLGVFRLSASLVMQLQSVLTVSGVNWKYEFLYVPCFLPFVVASLVCIALHRSQMPGSWHRPLTTAARKTRDTLSAILGALVLSELLAAGGDGSPAHILGFYLSSWLGRGYVAIAGLIGALGSFVSGSVLTGNMAFGSIQMVAAERLGVPLTGMLAVQVAGACAGKMMCISNILAGKVVLRELGQISEGEIVKHTIGVAGLFVLLGTALGLVFTLGGLLPDAPLP